MTEIVEQRDVVTRREKRWYVRGALLFCIGVFVYTLHWGDSSNALHVGAQSSVFWLGCFMLGALGLTEVLPMIPAVYRPVSTALPAPVSK